MQDALTLYVISAILGIVITYFLIKAAVKTAIEETNKDMTDLIVTQNRMLAKLLNEKGIPKGEIEKIFTDSKDEFWNGLTSGNK
ncbi:MAG: hypothetical protein ACK4E0_10890 [Chitinophagaceae bacterium]